VTQLCRDQGTQVVGEGVETEAEAEVLVDLGCDLLQGYVIARPGPAFVDPL
jgi:EAL domain-containing protein (putative c-di-GMP-specific phosphodiesterase class I)